MKINRISMITLGVDDLDRATRFYTAVLDRAPNPTYEGVAFFELPGTWLALYPREALARDISPDMELSSGGFGGVTLAHNARSREDVLAVLERAKSYGATILKEGQETFWGGFAGYYADLDNHCWEVAWGPMFDFTEKGELCFKK